MFLFSNCAALIEDDTWKMICLCEASSVWGFPHQLNANADCRPTLLSRVPYEAEFVLFIELPMAMAVDDNKIAYDLCLK